MQLLSKAGEGLRRFLKAVSQQADASHKSRSGSWSSHWQPDSCLQRRLLSSYGTHISSWIDKDGLVSRDGIHLITLDASSNQREMAVTG